MIAVKTIIDSVVGGSHKVCRLGSVSWEDDDGKLHREDGPAAIYADGSKAWAIHGLYHRVDGPAIQYSTGQTEWRINGKRHRLGAPAVTTEDGDKEYWVNGRQFTEGEFYRYIDQDTGEVLAPPGKKLAYDK
jgi:hypothetical protein